MTKVCSKHNCEMTPKLLSGVMNYFCHLCGQETMAAFYPATLETNKNLGCQRCFAFEQALRSTASQGTYDETAIRKAVGFELAEMIASAHEGVERNRMSMQQRIS